MGRQKSKKAPVKVKERKPATSEKPAAPTKVEKPVTPVTVDKPVTPGPSEASIPQGEPGKKPTALEQAEERLAQIIAKRRCDKCGQTGRYIVKEVNENSATLRCRGCQAVSKVSLAPSG